MSVRVQQEVFDLGHETLKLRGDDPQVGALVSFVGLVRDLNDEQTVSQMTLEHYPGMTEKALSSLENEARQRWKIIDALIIHRVGKLLPGDPIVLVAVTSAHRRDAFDACQFLMDALKTSAPFWKKETTPDGDRWVDARESDDESLARWKISNETH
jgi:molybdopterin synthase catalytic subunit